MNPGKADDSPSEIFRQTDRFTFKMNFRSSRLADLPPPYRVGLLSAGPDIPVNKREQGVGGWKKLVQRFD